jgi:hypothetical protein
MFHTFLHSFQVRKHEWWSVLEREKTARRETIKNVEDIELEVYCHINI